MIKNSKTLWIASIVCFVTIHISYGQIVISPQAQVNAGNAVISINCNFINKSAQINLTNASVVFIGINQELSTSSDLAVKEFEVRGSGQKNIFGNWEVKSKLILMDGVINVSPSSNFLFSGAQDQPVGHGTSYVLGKFSSQGVGARKFPVGTASGYFPMMLMEVKESALMSAEAVDGDPGMKFNDPELLQIINAHYWKLESPPSFSGSQVGLSTPGTQVSDLVIIASEGLGGEATNLGRHSQDSEYIISAENISSKQTILAFSGIEKIHVVVRNLITPNQDGDNDVLFIEEIERYPDNKVLLINRYGEKIKEWVNYKNDPSDFNFSNLGAGNYICILKFSSNGAVREISQMITIIK